MVMAGGAWRVRKGIHEWRRPWGGLDERAEQHRSERAGRNAFLLRDRRRTSLPMRLELDEAYHDCSPSGLA